MFQAPNPFFLAPMAGITDMPFRRLMKRLGAGVVISEFVSSHAVVHGGPRVQRYLNFHEDERPVGLQIFGGDEVVMCEAAKKIEALGVDFVDINLGCPVPKVTKKRGGSAWLCHPVDLGRMLGMLRKSIKIPLTIKIRTGWDAGSVNAKEIIRIAAQEGVDLVAIHGRTRAQGYAGSADWDLMGELIASATIPVVANGDIISGPQAMARLFQSKAFGVMIGRGALKNPWIFAESVETLKAFGELSEEDRKQVSEDILKVRSLPGAGNVPTDRDYYQRKVRKMQPKPHSFVADWVRIRADRDARALIDLHLELLRETYPEERVRFGFKKFLAWYSAGYPGSHQFRKFIFNSEDWVEICEKSAQFFESVKQLGDAAELNREQEPVLMSGHG